MTPARHVFPFVAMILLAALMPAGARKTLQSNETVVAE